MEASKMTIALTRQRLGTTAAAALLVLAGWTIGSAATQGRDADAVRKTLTDMAAAFERDDRAALERLWATDESVLVFENGHANVGWANYRDTHLGPEMAAMENTRFVLEDVRAHVTGSTAWVTLSYTISADVSGRRVDGNGLATVVLEKRDGRWLIVHWHSSNPRRQEARPPASGH